MKTLAQAVRAARLPRVRLALPAVIARLIVAWIASSIPALAAAGQSAILCSYSVTVLPDVDCGLFHGPGNPTAINAQGHVVGWFIQCGTSGYDDSFVWTGGPALTIIPRPAGMLGFFASDISDTGLIAGTADMTGVGQRGAIYNTNTGQWTMLQPVMAGGQSGLSAINGSGSKACGWRSIGPSLNPSNAFTYDLATGQITDLGLINGLSTSAADINDNGVVAGRMGIGQGTRPFLLIKGEVVDLGSLIGLETVPLGMNDSEWVVGRSRLSASINHAFLWTHQRGMIDLGTLSGHDLSIAEGVNDIGLVVGGSRLVSGADSRGWVWHSGTMRDLNSLVDGALISWANCVNNAGVVVASGASGGSGAALVLQPAAPVGDVDGNCSVDFDDLLLVIFDWGLHTSPADVDGDGVVGFGDLVVVLDHWTH